MACPRQMLAYRFGRCHDKLPWVVLPCTFRASGRKTMFPGAVNVGAQGNDPDQGTAQSLSLSTCCCRTAQSGYRTADDGRLQEDESEQRLRVAFVDGSLPEDIVRAVAERFSLEHWKVERNAHLPATDAGRVVARCRDAFSIPTRVRNMSRPGTAASSSTTASSVP